MGDINLDDLQKEISAAETYMREAVAVESSSASRSNLDRSRRADILQKFGRQPLGVATPPRYDSAAADHDRDDDVSVSSRYSTAEEREALVNRLLAEHRARKGETSPGMGDTLRGPLETSAGQSSSNADADPYDDTLFFASDLKLDQSSSSATEADPLRTMTASSSSLQERVDQALGRGVRTSQHRPHQTQARGRSRDKSRSSSTTRGGGRGARSASLEPKSRPAWGSNPMARKGSLSPSPRPKAPAPQRTAEEQSASDVRRSQAHGSVGWSLDAADGQTAAGATTSRRHLKSREDLEREVYAEFRSKHPFAPKLYTSSPPARSSSSARRDTSFPHQEQQQQQQRQRPAITERIEEMLRGREESLRTRDAMKRDMEKSELLDCTFHPTISRKARSSSARPSRGEGKGGEGVRHKDQARKTRVDESAGHRGKGGGGSGVSPDTDLAVADRLYAEAEARAEHQRYQEARRQEESMREFKFHPTINPRTQYRFDADASYRPIHERVGEVQRAHREHMARLKENYRKEEAREATFKVRIPPRSEELVRNVQVKEVRVYGKDPALFEGPISERLLNKGREHAARMHKLRQDTLAEQSQHMKQPPSSEGTEKLRRANADIAAPFATRQQIYAQKLGDRRNKLEQSRDEKEAAWFKPSVPAKSAKLAMRVRGNEDENDAELRTRLYKQDAEQWAIRTKLKEQEIYEDITFQPDIDPVSRALGRSSGLQELHTNPRGKAAREKAERKVREREDAACTFTPALHEYPHVRTASTRAGDAMLTHEALRHVGWAEDPAGPLDEYAAVARRDAQTKASPLVNRHINMKEPEKMAREIKQYLREKEERRVTRAAQMEVEELQQCTFQPKIPAAQTPIGADAAARPVVVRGIGRHLELKQLNEKIKAEKRAREQEVFRVSEVDTYRRLQDGSTIVKPFSLSDASARPSRAVLELRAREDAELTFAPATNELTRREFVRQLME